MSDSFSDFVAGIRDVFGPVDFFVDLKVRQLGWYVIGQLCCAQVLDRRQGEVCLEGR